MLAGECERGRGRGLAITFARLANKGASQVGKRLPRRLFPCVCVCVCVCGKSRRANENYCMPCAIQLSSGLRCHCSRRREGHQVEREKKKRSMYFLFICAACSLPHTPHSLVKSPSIRGAHLTC